ncbi:Squalene/phytoene synthase [Amylostereum chailletii]|nr:Squalene/phytoene synthase [Amylostereum chailletii]
MQLSKRLAHAVPRTARHPPSTIRRASSQANSSSVGTGDPAAYCKEFVRKHDYESYLLSQFFPRDKQPGYFALKAFYVEQATLQDTVSNATIGKMRMQFWRDAVKGITDGRPPHHPIALALYDVSKTSTLAPYHLKRIIDARDAELDSPGHMTADSLVAHAESTSSTLLYLLLSHLNLASETFSHAASHLGVAQSISVLLRALPFHASKGRMVIPAEITAKHGVVQDEVFRKGPAASGIDNAVFDFATLANDHLLTARSMFKESGGKVPRAAMPIFSAGVPVTSYLQRLESVNFDAFNRSLQMREWKMPWRVWRSYYNCTF